jgi:hypothetical protein
MENAFFIFTEQNNEIQIERFHICSWEFSNHSSLVEFGFEISKETIKKDTLIISLFIPWVIQSSKNKDLYEKLSTAENSRFIFNDSISSTKYLNTNSNNTGIIHTFSNRDNLCILPATISINEDQILAVSIDLKAYDELPKESRPNVYFRFWVEPSIPFISTRKRGISKSTVIYDIKVNERRNIPEERARFFEKKAFCKINVCFCFTIIPNKYEIVFLDNSTLKTVRTLEYESFNRYLDDKRMKKDELLVVFNKKHDLESFSFFSIYSLERIGTGQFALAFLINIICGVLIFLPGFRNSFNPELSNIQVWAKLPFEIILALSLACLTLLYFLWPAILNRFRRFFTWTIKKIKK